MSPRFTLLDLKPIDFSLTAGTNIPSPPASPIIPRPPTPGGGPLSSHPTSPSSFHIPGAYPTTPPVNRARTSPIDRSPSASPKPYRAPSPISPSNMPGYLSPAATISTDATSNSNSRSEMKRPSSVRKFLSLQRLRMNSHNNSTDSVPSPRTPSGESPSESPTASSVVSRPSIARRKSGSWFNSGRRRSGFFGRVDEADIVAQEDKRVDSFNSSPQLGAYTSSPIRSEPSPPRLPELGSLETGGSLGGEDMFKNIG
ncbi:hypothetical protein W97_04488 [Coniosporium apollinis CBS 100218]|uniref:Uncharacterized protein n=1 Tax=Coniosporium apollinis (strain CBS 100218) TaxID=1168221 RepID=R7YUA5_CONA1|nr:uncharacterized protein W97_04488 [Coniosporium apollinis CBS 100218]EON65251.1 hypothetical protein W97_04488 [Coniosporium apollinis CBS 100218]